MMTTTLNNTTPNTAAPPTALEVVVSFDGAVLAVHELRPGQSLVFGPACAQGGPQPDYPVDTLAAPLTVASHGDTPLCAFPADAAGGVRLADGRELTLGALREARLCEEVAGGLRYALPAGAELWAQVGPLQLRATLVARAERRLPRAPLDLRAARFVAGSLLAHGVLVALALLTPPDPRALASADLSRLDNRALARFIPPVPPEDNDKAVLGRLARDAAGRRVTPGGPPATGERVVHNAPIAPRAPRLGPGRGAPHVVDREQLKQQTRHMGVLGILGDLRQDSTASRLFADEGALAPGAAQALKGLVGVDGADPYGVGTTLVSAGPGGDCTGPGCDQTVLATLPGTCRGPRCGNGPGGHGVGDLPLRRRKPQGPEDMVMSKPDVKGSLPAELVRRVIRSRMNEFRFCYERALAQVVNSSGDDAARRGRVVVSFLIGGDGRVLSAVTREASLRNPQVQDCVTAAVRRLSFPQPDGAGLVQVSYPFIFQPAGE